jgi:Bacterial Ig-like domain/Cohesin domain
MVVPLSRKHNMNLYKIFLVALYLTLSTGFTYAASLQMSPATGVYTTGSTFTLRVVVNTNGKPINAADGTLSFNPQELRVVSVSRSSSIFNLWTTEPTFSNSAGTISFSGGTPTGYTGAGGTVMTVTFQTLSAGTPRVSVSSGSVLAADGRGTNILTSMGSGAYTVSAITTNPEPEAIVEYVPPANTPAAPKVSSATHSSEDSWSKERTAVLSWPVPEGVTAVRTLLDKQATSIPTKLYETPIRTITIDDLPDGVSYFHIQFKNEDGWGRVTHYRLAVDSTPPRDTAITLPADANLANPDQTLTLTTDESDGAPIATFKVQVNGGEPREIKPNENGDLVLEDLNPGYQTVVVELLDEAGNSAITSLNFTITAIEAPRFIDVPAVINPGVTPVITGQTSPRATVVVTLTLSGAGPQQFSVTSDDVGLFRFIPENALQSGVYSITAVATDEFGSQSLESNVVKLLVEESGLIKIGTYAISLLSVIIPLVALTFLLGFIGTATYVRLRAFRGIVRRESNEVNIVLHAEFKRLRALLMAEEEALRATRKTGKLTSGEENLLASIRVMIAEIESKISKEAEDVSELSK